MKRVVVTGIGVVSCLGNNQDEVYKALLNSSSIEVNNFNNVLKKIINE